MRGKATPEAVLLLRQKLHNSMQIIAERDRKIKDMTNLIKLCESKLLVFPEVLKNARENVDKMQLSIDDRDAHISDLKSQLHQKDMDIDKLLIKLGRGAI